MTIWPGSAESSVSFMFARSSSIFTVWFAEGLVCLTPLLICDEPHMEKKFGYSVSDLLWGKDIFEWESSKPCCCFEEEKLSIRYALVIGSSLTLISFLMLVALCVWLLHAFSGDADLMMQSWIQLFVIRYAAQSRKPRVKFLLFRNVAAI